MVTQLHKQTRNQRIVYFKWVNVCYVNYTSRLLLLKNELQEKLGEARAISQGHQEVVIITGGDNQHPQRALLQISTVSSTGFAFTGECGAKYRVSCKSNCDKLPEELLPALLAKMVKRASFKGFSLLKGLHQSFLIFTSLNSPCLRPK